MVKRNQYTILIVVINDCENEREEEENSKINKKLIKFFFFQSYNVITIF